MITDSKIWTNTINTTSGLVTCHPTLDGTVNTDALFSNIYSIHGISVRDTSTANLVINTCIKTISEDLKTVVLFCIQGTTVIIGGSSMATASNNIPIKVTIIGS